jgi:hypothetical protein
MYALVFLKDSLIISHFVHATHPVSFVSGIVTARTLVGHLYDSKTIEFLALML